MDCNLGPVFSGLVWSGCGLFRVLETGLGNTNDSNYYKSEEEPIITEKEWAAIEQSNAASCDNRFRVSSTPTSPYEHTY
jgi:hypothetical protein